MKLGFLVNPIAGLGGRVGLKGTDGVAEEAIAKGGKPISPSRAIEFLESLKRITRNRLPQMLTCPGLMGEDEIRAVEIRSEVLSMKIGTKTTAMDSKNAVRLMVKAKADLIIFVGGDGTAKDVLDALRKLEAVPVLGVPSGVKMYSGIFAVNPLNAAEVVAAFTEDQAEITELEIMDTDEKAIRNDVFSVKLYGYLKGPFLPNRIQGSKQVSPVTTSEIENQTAIGRFIIEEMDRGATYIIGPGTTTRRIATLLGVDKTILGVDIFREEEIILDVNERRILDEVHDWRRTWIILSPIGRQGILFGRGNQQISPEIIQKVGKERIIVVATKSKLSTIEGGILRIDSGEPVTDEMLRGYIKVVTDYREWRLMPVR